MRNKQIALAAIATALIVFVITGGGTLQNCPAEDSTNCYWNAATQGNGEGRNFIDLSGHVIYLP